MGLFKKISGLFGGGGGGSGRSLDDLAARMGMSAPAIAAVRVDYRTFAIPKNSGGNRTISSPAPELKRVQKLILKRVLGRLPAHEAAMGFERGVSFVDHGARHAGASVIIRMDLKDFFPSTTETRVRAYLEAIGWQSGAVRELVRLCCHRGALPQGAPTSPRLSNLVNGLMDSRLAGAAEACGAEYSRYADDIVFSLPEDDPQAVRGLISLSRVIVAECGYRLNRKKGPRVMRGHQRQWITGLVVNDGTARLPRETRRWLRAVEHRAALGSDANQRPTLTATQLAGWRALAAMVEDGGED